MFLSKRFAKSLFSLGNLCQYVFYHLKFSAYWERSMCQFTINCQIEQIYNITTFIRIKTRIIYVHVRAQMYAGQCSKMNEINTWAHLKHWVPKLLNLINIMMVPCIKKMSAFSISLLICASSFRDCYSRSFTMYLSCLLPYSYMMHLHVCQ